MINKLLNLFCIGFMCLVSFISMAQTHTLQSPDKSITLTIDMPTTVDKKTPVHYFVKVNNTTLLKKASAFIQFEQDSRMLDMFTFQQAQTTTINRILTPVVKQKSATIVDHFNQILFTFDAGLSLTFRVYDSGVAYRFSRTSSDAFRVRSEQVNFAFKEGASTLFPKEESFISHNERLYQHSSLAKLSEEDFASLPLLVNVDDVKIVITETGLQSYPGLWLKGSNNHQLQATFPHYVEQASLKKNSDRNEVISKRGNYIAKYSAQSLTHPVRKIDFPWRIMAIAKNDADLLTNQLSYLLAKKNQLKDSAWIKPGKVAWDWWNANNIYGVDFAAGINTDTYKYYVDFAAQYGLDYIILDEGWYQLGDVLAISPNIDVQEVIQYAKSKNVEVILWVIWETLDQQLEKALDTFQSWGAAGIKVDFMQRDDQFMVDYYWRVAKAAAKRQLLVNFHGSYKPAGLRRTYPNVITREGLRGLEHNKWADYITSRHNLTLPFIRMLAGPMDYTPGAMVNAQPKNFRVVFDRPMSQTTRAHQVAMYVVYESPLQMLADSPSNYLSAHETTTFISAIPTVWDETIVISAKIADHIVIARRNGDTWYIGVMNNEEEKSFDIPLSFLTDASYRLQAFADGINANNYASDYQLTTQQVTVKDTLAIKAAKNGGWAAIITPNTTLKE